MSINKKVQLSASGSNWHIYGEDGGKTIKVWVNSKPPYLELDEVMALSQALREMALELGYQVTRDCNG